VAAVPVTVFADFVCPFCYVTEAALWRLEDEGLAVPAYRAYELYPVPAPLPAEVGGDWPEALFDLAREAGVALTRPLPAARTRKAHEAARFAESKGVGRAFRQAAYAAYFGEGRDVGRIDVLVELARGVGLDETEAKVVLDVDTFAPAVAADGALARRLGIEAVPALIVGEGERARLVTGAQSYGALRREVEDAAG
jgi:predicted DsbA family dithiol-disulfide isomerase